MKLIASDFDGTILLGETVGDEVINAIKRWQAAGNVFAVISGRNTPDIRRQCDRYGVVRDYTLGDSGNTCFRGDELWYSNVVDAFDLPKIVNTLLLSDTDYICINRPDVARIIYHRSKNGEILKNDTENIKDITEFSQISGFWRTDELTAKAEKDFNEIFAPSRLAMRNFNCLDIVPESRTKSVCIAELAEKLGVGYDDIYVVGDNYNDIPMLSSYKSFAMANGPLEVQAHASVGIVRSVAEMIEKLI